MAADMTSKLGVKIYGTLAVNQIYNQTHVVQ